MCDPYAIVGSIAGAAIVGSNAITWNKSNKKTNQAVSEINEDADETVANIYAAAEDQSTEDDLDTDSTSDDDETETTTQYVPLNTAGTGATTSSSKIGLNLGG